MAAGRIFDGRQLTAARALAGLTVIELAVAAGVTKRTVHRLETGGEVHVSAKKRHGHVSAELWGRIEKALRVHGVELLPEAEGRGSGVRWVKCRRERRCG